jgi:hypothetical protein
MLEKISDVPDSVLGFRASGELTSDDYRNVLVPAVAAALQSPSVRSRTSVRLSWQGLVADRDQADPDVEAGQAGGVEVLAEHGEVGGRARSGRVHQHPVTRGDDANH